MISYLQKLRTLDARREARKHGGHPAGRTVPTEGDATTVRDGSAVAEASARPQQQTTNYEITSTVRLQQPESTNYEATAAVQEQASTNYEITPSARSQQHRSTNYEITRLAQLQRQQATNYEKTSLRPRGCSPANSTNYEIIPASPAQPPVGTNYEITSLALPRRGTNHEITSRAARQSAEPRRVALSGPDPQSGPGGLEQTRQSVRDALERYVSHRLSALRSLDSEAILGWLRAYGMTWPSGRAFWIRVHRMRTWPRVGLSKAERATSGRWLDGVAGEMGAFFWDERLAARLERVPGTGGISSLGAHCIRGEVQMDINEYLGGDHLRREDVPKPILVTVTDVSVKEFDNPPEKKAVLHFAETERSLVANKTNLRIAKTVFGTSETEHWKGKKIVVYDDPNIFFAGKQTGGLRLRAPKTAEAPQEDVPF